MRIRMWNNALFLLFCGIVCILLHSVGRNYYLLFSISFIIILELFLFPVDGVNTRLIILKRAVDDLPVDNNETRKRVKQLLRVIKDLKPLSGYGLFTVDRSTLTNMMSVSITYLIVLVQFKQNSMQKYRICQNI